MDRHVWLIGMPGSGKTSVGRALSELIGLPLVDLDARIEERAGRSIPEIFREQGEERFRELEGEVVAEAAAGDRAVISCGGGAPLRRDNSELMRSTGTVVWLHVPLASLRARLRDIIIKRPLVKDPLDLERLYRERDGVYREVAHHVVRTEGDPREVARAVLEVVT